MLCLLWIRVSGDPAAVNVRATLPTAVGTRSHEARNDRLAWDHVIRSRRGGRRIGRQAALRSVNPGGCGQGEA